MCSRGRWRRCCETERVTGELGPVGLVSPARQHPARAIDSDDRSYFLAYEWLVQRHIRVNGVKRDEISPLWAVTYGAAAGFALWAT